MEIPIIEPSQDDIKEKPDEIELFPYSDSSIWSAFKKDNEINDVESDLDSTQTNITKDNHKDSINNKTVSESIKTDDTFDGIPEPDKSERPNVEKEKKIQEDIIKELDHKKDKISSNENKFITNQKAPDKNSGFYVIQLASVSEVILIDKEWNRLTKIYKDLLNKKYNYKKINLKNGKTFYRLLVGEFASKGQASDFCKLSLKRDICIIKYYE